MIRLDVEGKPFTGWTGGTIRRGINEMAGAFALQYTDRWSPNAERWVILPDDECTLYVDDEEIITGYVVSSEIDIEGEDYAVSSQGYSLAGHLTKADAIYKSGQWRNQTFGRIVADLLHEQPIGLRLDFNPPDKISRFEIEDGEKIYDCLERLCRVFGCVMTSDPDGALRILRTDSPTRQLLPIDPPYARRVTRDFSGRHNLYISKGQLAGTKDYNGTLATTPKGALGDSKVRRVCPLIIQNEGPGGKKFLEQRALWERNVRAGRSLVMQASWLGVRGADGKLLTPGNVVEYRDDFLGLGGDLLIESVEIQISESAGITSTLTLVPPVTYSSLDLPQSVWRGRGGAVG